VVMAAVGGLGTIRGALIGSTIVLLLVDTLSRIATMSGMPSTAPVVLSYAVYAILLVVAVLFMPGGAVALVAALRARASKTRTPAALRQRDISAGHDARGPATSRHGSPS